ncbi:unnamed protein product [Rhodiola kirilowii]
MEDSVASCSDKLSRFRIKELKDILSQLGLSKQGRKQDLLQRIMLVLSDEQVYKMPAKKSMLEKGEIVHIIEDTYRKMQPTSTTGLGATGEGVSNNNSLQHSEEHADSYESPVKIRCLCENSLSTESMIQCDDKKCCIWQHLSCVIIPDEPKAGCFDPPEVFYCEMCRLSRADPFLLTIAHPLNPVKLAVKTVPVDGSNPVLHVAKSFQLTKADKDLVSKQEYDVQAWCMLVNDKVSYRMQWPQYAELQVNGMPVRATNRPGSQVLGSNGRDDGPIITPCTRDGLNKISLEASDTRTFCFGVRLIKRRSLQQIRNLVPKESDGESIEEALARVQRCIGGGASTKDTDSDNELVVIADSHVISLRCPMSGSRIKVAGRFRPCVHLGGFDLDIFLEMNQRSRKWQCPICLKNYSLENIIIDPYFNRITSMMQNCSDDVTDIEVKPDGRWRVKTKNESERRSVGDLAHWHFSTGSLCDLTEREDSENIGMPCRVKQEDFYGSATGQNLQVDEGGLCDLIIHEDTNTFLDSNKKQKKLVARGPKVVPMSITASGSGRDEEDSSVNQDGYGTTDYINNGVEHNSVSMNSDPAPKDRFSYAHPTSAEIIELSDSEDDELMIVAEAAHNSCSGTAQIDFNLPISGIPSSYPGGHSSKATEVSEINYPVIEVPEDWDLPFESEADCDTGLFNPSAAVSASVAHIQQSHINGPSSTNGDIAPPTSDTIAVPSNNIFPFGGADPSLQMYHPPTPSNVSMDYEVSDQINVPNGNHSGDWISLRVGDSQSDNNKSAAASKGLDLTNQLLPEENAGDPMADDATLLLGLTDGGSNKASRPRSDFPFLCPRQNRSVRRRTYLSLDSD